MLLTARKQRRFLIKILHNQKKLRGYIEQKNLSSYTLLDLNELSNIIEVPSNELIIKAGTPAHYLLFLIKGEIIITYPASNGRETCIKYYKDGGLIGEAASLWESIPNMNVKAVSNCTFVGVDLNKYRKEFLNDVVFLKTISKILTNKMNNNQDLIKSLSDPLDVRLADFILFHSINDFFDFKLTTCAKILNTSYRHLLRMMKLFSDLKILKKEKRKYRILDAQRLVDIRNGNSLSSVSGK